MHHYNSTHYCNTETVSLFIFPFLQTNITSQMWPTGGMGEWKDQVHEVIECLQSSNFRLICVLICAVGAEDTEMVRTNPVRVQWERWTALSLFYERHCHSLISQHLLLSSSIIMRPYEEAALHVTPPPSARLSVCLCPPLTFKLHVRNNWQIIFEDWPHIVSVWTAH